MKHFSDPELEILKFNIADVITTSGEFGVDGEDWAGWG